MSHACTIYDIDANLEQCIYCSADFDATRGQGDHIIPAALGEFQGDTRFYRICTHCNNRIGRSEQQLLQCGLESVLRDCVKPGGRRRKKRGSSRMKTVLGAPAPQSTIEHGDHNELVSRDRSDYSKVYPIDQLVIHNDEGDEYFVRLYPGMSVDSIQEKIQHLGITPKTVWIHCTDSRFEEYRELAGAALPGGTLRQLQDTEAGIQSVQGCTKFTMTDHSFRAIAKIALHYYLVHTRRKVRGDESEFFALRHFIMNGGNKDQFFHASGRQFVMPFRSFPFGGCITPPNWCHVLVADERGGVVVVCVQLFVGPGSVPLAHYITLGPIASRLVLPDLIWAHVYHYDTSGNSARYAGRVETMTLTRTNPWPC